MNIIVTLFIILVVFIAILIIDRFIYKKKKKIGLIKSAVLYLRYGIKKLIPSLLFDVIFVLGVTFIVLLVSAKFSKNMEDGLSRILKVQGQISTGIIFGFVAAWATILALYNTSKILKEISKPIYEFDDLMDEIDKIVERLSSYTLDEVALMKPYFYIYSKTPALGNISSPEKYNRFKGYLFAMIEKKIEVRAVCLKEANFDQFHGKYTSDLTILNGWNQQAKEVLNKIKSCTKHVTNPAIELGDISNTFAICSPREAFEFIIKAEAVNGKNVILGHKITNARDIRFMKEAIQQYWT